MGFGEEDEWAEFGPQIVEVGFGGLPRALFTRYDGGAVCGGGVCVSLMDAQRRHSQATTNLIWAQLMKTWLAVAMVLCQLGWRQSALARGLPR